jgi:two-component system chemotaxis response regulator CheY
VIEAKDGHEALALFRHRKPDLVLLDIEMPGMNGLTALHQMRRADAGARIVMLTSMAQRSIVEHATRSGALEFVVKPIQVEPLLAMVEKVIGKAEDS